MKKVFLYILILLVSLSLTGCFSSANMAKSDLHSTKTEANSAVNSNEEGKNAARGETNEINKESYKNLVTPKW